MSSLALIPLALAAAMVWTAKGPPCIASAGGRPSALLVAHNFYGATVCELLLVLVWCVFLAERDSSSWPGSRSCAIAYVSAHFGLRPCSYGLLFAICLCFATGSKRRFGFGSLRLYSCFNLDRAGWGRPEYAWPAFCFGSAR